MSYVARIFASALLIYWTISPCRAQQPLGPRTLENLLNSGEVQEPYASPVDDTTGAGLLRPAETVTRPKDGVQHPDLDKAWAEYDAAAAKGTEAIKTAIAKQFDAAAAKGDLDAAEKWQVIGEKFDKFGELPTAKETKAVVNAAAADLKRGKEGLAKAYERVVKIFTMDKNIAEAKRVRQEMLRVMVEEQESSSRQADLTPHGRWIENTDNLIRSIDPDGSYREIDRKSGRLNTTGAWQVVGPNSYKTHTENGWTIWFHLLDSERMEFRNKGPDGTTYPPYVRFKE